MDCGESFDGSGVDDLEAALEAEEWRFKLGVGEFGYQDGEH
jgi:hypothetical protein